jgi:hypothetical protein
VSRETEGREEAREPVRWHTWQGWSGEREGEKRREKEKSS